MRATDIPPGILPTQRGLYYGGAWHAPKAGVYAETINPTYNEAITTAPVADAQDVDAAAPFGLRRDVEAQALASAAYERARALRRFHQASRHRGTAFNQCHRPLV